MNMHNSELILGVLRVEENLLRQHYKKTDSQFPVIIGRELWHRLTAFENFYSKLVLI